jgi:hypothetical protein
VGLSLACVSALLILAVIYRVAGLLIVEVKVVLLVLVPGRTGLGCIKDYRVAGIRRESVLGILGIIGQLILLVLGRAVIVLRPRPGSIITKLVDMLLLL